MSDGPGVLVSIVVACRNEVAHIGDLLDSILLQNTEGIAWEAIVADGMSTDGTQEKIREYCARDQRISLLNNEGRIVSTGLNKAVRAARGQFIIRMDAHTVYAPDYVRCCIETLEKTGADNVGGPARTKAQGTLGNAVAAAFHSRFSTGGGKFHDVNFEGWVDTVPYGCWRKSMLERIGLFDEALVRNQDDELNLRLHRAGGRVWQSPAIKSWYTPRAQLGKLFRQYFQYGFWKVAVIRKHRLPSSWRHMVPVFFVLGIVAGPLAMAAATVFHLHFWLMAAVAVWGSGLALYILANLAASVHAAKRAGWNTFFYLPAVFAVYHVSYGVGFSLGLFTFLARPVLPSSKMNESAFTSISR